MERRSAASGGLLRTQTNLGPNLMASDTHLRILTEKLGRTLSTSSISSVLYRSSQSSPSASPGHPDVSQSGSSSIPSSARSNTRFLEPTRQLDFRTSDDLRRQRRPPRIRHRLSTGLCLCQILLYGNILVCLYLYMAFSTLSSMVIQHHQQSEEKIQSLENVRASDPVLGGALTHSLSDVKSLEGDINDGHSAQDLIGSSNNKVHMESSTSREVAIGSRKLGPGLHRGQNSAKSSSERPAHELGNNQKRSFEEEQGQAFANVHIENEHRREANENSLYENGEDWNNRELAESEFSMSLTVLYSDNRENLRKGSSFCDQLIINAETPNVITGEDVISAIQRDNPGLDVDNCTFRYSMTQSGFQKLDPSRSLSIDQKGTTLLLLYECQDPRDSDFVF